MYSLTLFVFDLSYVTSPVNEYEICLKSRYCIGPLKPSTNKHCTSAKMVSFFTVSTRERPVNYLAEESKCEALDPF